MAAAIACVLASAATVAAPGGAGNKGRDRAAFSRGEPSSKAKRVKLPPTEAVAIANKRIVAHGIVELQLPEDRIVNLDAVKNLDGSIRIDHGVAGDAPMTDAAAAEVSE